jgi:hypothetical protein
MFEFQRRVRRLVVGLMARRPAPHLRRSGAPMDWLPPVLDPGDWSVGLMADRSAGWYFDRN